MDNQNHFEKTNADAISVAFDYQYYYFLLKVLNLKDGQSVGFEVMDDVHTKLNDDIQILMQLKHTVQRNSQGNPVNLTTFDMDIWHTIDNWRQVITDSKDSRSTIKDQISFVKKTFFVLISNKSETDKNKFIKLLRDFQNNQIDIITFSKGLNLLPTDSDTINGYRKTLLALNQTVLESFLRNIEFELNATDLIGQCKTSLLSDKIPMENIDELFQKLDSNIREENFNAITKGQKIIIYFSDYLKKYRIHYDRARNTELKIRKFTYHSMLDLKEQNFIKYLIDIHDITVNDEDDIIEFTKHKFQMENNIHSWLQESELTDDEFKDFENEVITIWKNEFRAHTRGELSEEEINEKALLIIDQLREKKLKLTSLDLDIPNSNGEFYILSDALKIGWRKDWKIKYNG